MGRSDCFFEDFNNAIPVNVPGTLYKVRFAMGCLVSHDSGNLSILDNYILRFFRGRR
jgi:hypothetical protein